MFGVSAEGRLFLILRQQKKRNAFLCALSDLGGEEKKEMI